MDQLLDGEQYRVDFPVRKFRFYNTFVINFIFFCNFVLIITLYCLHTKDLYLQYLFLMNYFLYLYFYISDNYYIYDLRDFENLLKKIKESKKLYLYYYSKGKLNLDMHSNSIDENVKIYGDIKSSYLIVNLNIKITNLEEEMKEKMFINSHSGIASLYYDSRKETIIVIPQFSLFVKILECISALGCFYFIFLIVIYLKCNNVKIVVYKRLFS